METQPVAKKPFYKRWWVWLVGIIVLFIIIGASSGGGATSDQSKKEANKESEQVVTPAQKVTAETLMRDYQANEVAADSKYKGQIVEVSGIVDTIGKDILDNPYVSFKTNEVIFTIQCMFDKSQAEQLAGLSKGQKLTVQGKVSGKLGNIILRECKY